MFPLASFFCDAISFHTLLAVTLLNGLLVNSSLTYFPLDSRMIPLSFRQRMVFPCRTIDNLWKWCSCWSQLTEAILVSVWSWCRRLWFLGSLSHFCCSTVLICIKGMYAITSKNHIWLCVLLFFNSQHFGIKERDLSRTEFCEKCVWVVSMLSSWAFSKAVNCNERYNYQVSVKHFHSHFISHVLQMCSSHWRNNPSVIQSLSETRCLLYKLFSFENYCRRNIHDCSNETAHNCWCFSFFSRCNYLNLLRSDLLNLLKFSWHC